MPPWTDLITRLMGKPLQPWLPEGLRVYSIGDIHGCLEPLETLVETIREDASVHPGETTVVFLGDYVDRGPDSKPVVDYLLNDPIPEHETIFLRGNHEQAMLEFLEQPGIGEMWLTFGGQNTLTSYEASLGRIPSRPEDFIELSELFASRVPSAHVEFLRSTRPSFEAGSYFFCHAGIRPGVSLDRQDTDDLLWIRDEFVDSRRVHEKIVVHGHTVTREPELLPNRIGIDTGAYESGVLTCLVLEGDQQRILQT